MNNICAIPPLFEGENVEELHEQVDQFQKYSKQKRNWENAFQNWSNRMALDDNYTGSLGVCGWGAICDYCEDNSYGRPCVRALNAWCRAKGKRIDYTERDFEKVWRGEV